MVLTSSCSQSDSNTEHYKAENDKLTEKNDALNKQVEALESTNTQLATLIEPQESESLFQATTRILDTVKATQSSLISSQTELDDLKKKYATLNSHGDLSTLEEKFTKLQDKHNKTQTKIGILEAQLTQKNAEVAHSAKFMNADRKLQALINTKNSEIASLRAQINQINAASNLFVESTDKLPKNAKNLFTRLKDLEGSTTAEQQKAYKTFLAKHKATALNRISFEDGKTDLSTADLSKIKEITKTNNPNSYFLVVGYADKTGDAAKEKSLSTKCASNIASELNKNKKGFQVAQAIYLGQTTRFGEPKENRTVEIWLIN